MAIFTLIISLGAFFLLRHFFPATVHNFIITLVAALVIGFVGMCVFGTVVDFVHRSDQASVRATVVHEALAHHTHEIGTANN